jgi:hypothetical protein
LIALADIRSAGIVVIGAAALEPVEPSRLGNASSRSPAPLLARSC